MDHLLTVEETERAIRTLSRQVREYADLNNEQCSYPSYRNGWRYGTYPAEFSRAWEGDDNGREYFPSFDRNAIHGPRLPRYTGSAYLCTGCEWQTSPDGCRFCRPELYVSCDFCGNSHLDGHSCTCWTTCDCGTYGPPRITADGNSGNYYCSEDCAENNGAAECNSCNRWTSNDDGECEYCRPCSCGSCSECRDRANIHSYSYKPTPLFKGTGPLYLGLECEIDVAASRYSLTDIAEYVNGRLDDGSIGYLKSDSSIDCGFEVVTHPMSYRWAMEQFPWDMYGELSGTYGVREEDECGIHVHASRDGFSGTRHLYMWQRFFYRNAEPITQLARRESNRWASFGSEARHMAALVAKRGGYEQQTVRADSWLLPRDVRDMYRRQGYPSDSQLWTPTAPRYSAINVQNRHTLEVRVFAGSVDATPVQAALGLVHASIEYTRNLDTQSVLKKSGWSWQPFRNWVADRDDTYPALNSEIERLVTV